jgi:hypothetical protein
MIRKALLITWMALASCYGGTRDPSVPDSKYLEYGAQHKCVVPIYGECGCGSGKYHEFAASAVVISPRWVVTAAHVVKDRLSFKVKVKEKEFVLKRVVINKNFQEDGLGRYDIALGESEEDMDLDFYPKLYRDKGESGRIASICGYGVTGTFGTGANISDGKKRAGSNRVERCEGHVLVCSAGRRKTNMDFLISHGDSGGGLFIDGKLAGINSFVSATDGKPDSNYGDESSHTRMSLFADWVDGVMRGEDSDGVVEGQ